MCDYCEQGEEHELIMYGDYFVLNIGQKHYLSVDTVFEVLGTVVKAGEDASINYCPMCGRDLRGGAE